MTSMLKHSALFFRSGGGYVADAKAVTKSIPAGLVRAVDQRQSQCKRPLQCNALISDI